MRLLAAGISKENVQSARRDAIEKARAHFMELYACDGRCDKRDAFCALGVEIKRDRTGRVKTRTIQLGPGDALYDRTGVSSVVQRYLTHKIFCAPACGCVEPDPLPSQGEGNVEQYDASYGGVIVTFGD